MITNYARWSKNKNYKNYTNIFIYTKCFGNIDFNGGKNVLATDLNFFLRELPLTGFYGITALDITYNSNFTPSKCTILSSFFLEVTLQKDLNKRIKEAKKLNIINKKNFIDFFTACGANFQITEWLIKIHAISY